MATLISLRSKLVQRLMSIPYDTKDESLQAKMKVLTKQIELINARLKN
jgi:hypothetical protein